MSDVVIDEAVLKDIEEHDEQHSATSPDSKSAASSDSGCSPLEKQASTGRSSLLGRILELCQDQHKLKAQKKALAKDMRNALKKRKRLQTKASQLSDLDLIEVLQMREDRRCANTKTGAV